MEGEHSPDESAEDLAGRPTINVGRGAGRAEAKFRRLAAEEERYEIGRLLGQGGMANVFEAHDRILDRTVALKVLRPELADDADQRRRFLYEAHLLGQMDHPGALPVHGAGELPGHGPFYVMRRVQGRTLRYILGHPGRRRRARDEIGRLVGYFDQICQTVAYAHSRGIVHRDLKPENIMVDDYGVVLVMDWGISKKVDESLTPADISSTQNGVVKGSPAYMAPEQARGDVSAIDLRTDVFSLGIILYEILTGYLPFSGTSHSEVLREILDHEPELPHRLNRACIPRALSAICMKALAKDPEERYASARELADDVRHYLNREPVAAHSPSPLERLGNWVQRHTVLATAIATATVLILLLAALATYKGGVMAERERSRHEREQLLAQRERDRREQQIRDTLAEIRRHADEARGLQYRIEDTRDQLAGARGRATEAGRGLRQQIRELEVARQQFISNIVALTAQLIGHMEADGRRGPDSWDPEVLAIIRNLILEWSRELTDTGELYQAHALVWVQLNDRGPLGWTENERRSLEALKERIENLMRERFGDDFDVPDWSEYGIGKLGRWAASLQAGPSD
jgi:tRNA A-37 threonylcarbamoyl transferase component Bud32